MSFSEYIKKYGLLEETPLGARAFLSYKQKENVPEIGASIWSVVELLNVEGLFSVTIFHPWGITDIMAKPADTGRTVGGIDYTTFQERYPQRWPYLLEVLQELEPDLKKTAENRATSKYALENVPGYV